MKGKELPDNIFCLVEELCPKGNSKGSIDQDIKGINPNPLKITRIPLYVSTIQTGF